MPTIHDFLAQAEQARQAGNIDHADSLCRHILNHAPDCGAAWHLLGALCDSRGQPEQALACYVKATELLPDFADAHFDLGHTSHALGRLSAAAAAFRRALELQPTNSSAHANLGAILQQQGQLDEAAACYRRAVELQPDFAEARANLAAVCHQQGQLDEAAAQYRRAIEDQPDVAELHALLGLVLNDQRDFNAAIRAFRQSIALDPDQPEAYNNLGVACQNQGQLDDALTAYQQALALRPDYAEAHNNLGVVYQNSDELEKSVACFRRALEIKPHFVEAFNNLALSLQYQDHLDEAAAALQQALALNPNFAAAYNHLGNVRKDQARHEEALASYRRALAENPNLTNAHSNLCFCLQFCPGVTAAEILAEHKHWNDRYAAPLEKNTPPHTNDRNPDRRLRIGYVSPDFRNHCQLFFTKPLLSHHNHADFEIFCYADVPSPDTVTARLKTCADHWRNICGLSASQTADLIRADQIDVLIDLTMHMKRSHLLAFARQPAPVQICWLAYPGTTGLTTIDYRLTDPYLDPPGLFDRFYSEESIRLPDTFWCYDPLISEPPVNELPALAAGHITFGCLNNFCKINDGTLDLFARVLNAVARSRLILLVGEGAHRDRTRDFFIQNGIDTDRLIFVPRQSRHRYLEQYHQIDIGLDTLPYNGHTTSLDALWMGVPVVTLVGDTVVGRAGLSQLTNLALTELIATTPNDYISTITRLASDLPHLSRLRSTLRSRLQQSPLMNAPLFTKNIEQTYRQLFHRWCNNHSPASQSSANPAADKA